MDTGLDAVGTVLDGAADVGSTVARKGWQLTRQCAHRRPTAVPSTAGRPPLHCYHATAPGANQRVQW